MTTSVRSSRAMGRVTFTCELVVSGTVYANFESPFQQISPLACRGADDSQDVAKKHRPLCSEKHFNIN